MREYTDPVVLTTGVDEGWADRETDPTEIDWERRRKRAKIPFEVVDGRPVNPREKTRIQRGRNKLGRWGENLTADALVSVRDGFGNRWVLLVQRNRGRGWGLPGGFLEEGESAVEAAIRELLEEAGVDLRHATWRETEPRFVVDERASDEAWLVTTMCVAELGMLRREEFPDPTPGDDVIDAAWVRAANYRELAKRLWDDHGGVVLSENHVGMLTDWFTGI